MLWRWWYDGNVDDDSNADDDSDDKDVDDMVDDKDADDDRDDKNGDDDSDDKNGDDDSDDSQSVKEWQVSTGRRPTLMTTLEAKTTATDSQMLMSKMVMGKKMMSKMISMSKINKSNICVFQWKCTNVIMKARGERACQCKTTWMH